MDDELSGHSRHEPTTPTKPQDSKVAPRKNINKSSDAAAKFRRHAPGTNDKPPQCVHFSEKSLDFAQVAVGTEPNDPLTGPEGAFGGWRRAPKPCRGAAAELGVSGCGLDRRVAATEARLWVQVPDAGHSARCRVPDNEGVEPTDENVVGAAPSTEHRAPTRHVRRRRGAARPQPGTGADPPHAEGPGRIRGPRKPFAGDRRAGDGRRRGAGSRRSGAAPPARGKEPTSSRGRSPRAGEASW